MRRKGSMLITQGRHIDELDMWPGDEVYMGHTLVGVVNRDGVLVSHLGTLH